MAVADLRSTAGWGATAFAVSAVILATACGERGVAQSGASTVDEDPGVIHIHELAAEPDSGVVYAATHTGLFRIGKASAERVGQHFHDLMGFTVTSDGDFLASGHPDLRTSELQAEGKPPLLGLAESPDNGASWTPISLLGEVDFHALDVRGDTVYGADSTSGRFMVSDDRGRTWTTRSEPALTDFAVSPDDADLIIATGGSGPLRSRDGGRSWKPLTTSPLALVAWEGEVLSGAWPDGTVVVSSDQGDTWQRRGALPGTPEALLVTGEEILASASGTGIVRSTDGGRTWDVMYAINQPSGS